MKARAGPAWRWTCQSTTCIATLGVTCSRKRYTAACPAFLSKIWHQERTSKKKKNKKKKKEKQDWRRSPRPRPRLADDAGGARSRRTTGTRRRRMRKRRRHLMETTPQMCCSTKSWGRPRLLEMARPRQLVQVWMEELARLPPWAWRSRSPGASRGCDMLPFLARSRVWNALPPRAMMREVAATLASPPEPVRPGSAWSRKPTRRTPPAPTAAG
mmetsp:Transcript_96609/g.288433  ORF Transcript_96609/g.288433 Transcript_96609/m.288433 type:complete len:214 (-) Transcript_96609:754-1395(-)